MERELLLNCFFFFGGGCESECGFGGGGGGRRGRKGKGERAKVGLCQIWTESSWNNELVCSPSDATSSTSSTTVGLMWGWVG